MRSIILWTGVALAACSAPPPYPARAMADPDQEKEHPVQILDEELVDAVVAGNPVLDRVQASNQLEVQVPLRNVSDEDLELSIDVEFLDAQDNPYGDRSTRQHLILASGDTRTVRFLSSRSRAAGFMMRVRSFR